MISVKRPSVSSHPSAHHHHHQTHHHYQHKQHHQPHSLQNGASSTNSVTSAPLVTTTSANNNRIIRSRNQLSTGSEQHQEGKLQHPNHWNPHNGGFVSNGGSGIGTFSSVGGGQANRPTGSASWTGTGSGCSIITNGGSLYYSNGGYGVSTASVNPKIRDIYEFDSLFLLPACALTSDKALNLRKDLAAYDFNIKILEDSPRASHNVWQCKF
uniref:Uncharacterized protein n=1 Tax=Anopheles culicifacies TaxID=139723 RepID=A0A182MJE5_9DIPT